MGKAGDEQFWRITNCYLYIDYENVIKTDYNKIQLSKFCDENVTLRCGNLLKMLLITSFTHP